MSRQLDAISEERTARRHKELVRALEFELVKVVQEGGRELAGFSVRISDWECLITLRAAKGDKPQVCFVGAEDVVGVITKAVRLGRAEKLVWKADDYRANGG